MTMTKDNIAQQSRKNDVKNDTKKSLPGQKCVGDKCPIVKKR